MYCFKIFSFIISSAILTSCMVGPDFKTPDTPNTTRYTENPLPAKTISTTGAAGKSQQFIPNRDIPAQWWTVFHSKTLNALIAEGLKNNPTLQAAQATLRQADQTLKAGIGAQYYPSANLQLGVTPQQFSNTVIGFPGEEFFTLYNVAANVTYNFDLFGSARRTAESLRAQVDYQRFQLEATYLTLAANIVTTAIAEASIRAQIHATETLIHSQETILRITQQQFKLGDVAQSDVLAAQTQLAQTRATLPPLQKTLGQVRHSLAVLVGKTPSQARLPVFHLEDLTLPAHLPVSLPSKLVQQRPDVRAASALLNQASAQVGVATAARLPQFSLTGSYGYDSDQPGQIFTPNNIAWSLANQLTQPIFNAGSLRAQQAAAVAAYEAAGANYQQTVLSAFQNVADSLHAIQTDAIALKAQTEAEKAARATYLLIKGQYKLGAVSYLSWLDAERQYQQARIARIQAQAARFADTAALFQALGGGWWNRGK